MKRDLCRRGRDLARLGVPKPSSCGSCAGRRHAATAASASSHDSTSQQDQIVQQQQPIRSNGTENNHLVRAGIVLSRAPQITRDLNPFEKAFFLYQRRMNERTAMPFPRYFYIQKETPADIDWKRKIKHRKTPARDIGNWSAWDKKEGWNDELIIGSTISEPSEQVERLLEDAKLHEDAIDKDAPLEEEDIERPLPRATEADQNNDTKSLNRALTRNLYLLVKLADGHWQFPSAVLEGRESLQRAAERIIVQSGGINMNTWIIGNAPVGYHTWKYPTPAISPESGAQHIGEKTFFMKGRIMAGKMDLSINQFGFRDHQWLSKDEIEKTVKISYWNSIKNMLSNL